MYNISYYRVHSFTSDNYSGNPAGVCLLGSWLKESEMQQIAFENNLSETAFIVKEEAGYRIRWFTPSVEVDLCGHATLAAGFVFFDQLKLNQSAIEFNSKSGKLRVENGDGIYSLDFPTDKIQKSGLPEIIKSSFEVQPIEVYRGNTDYLLVLSDEEKVRNCTPDLNKLKNAGGRGVIITAKGNKVDFVSRFFAPQSGIDEDPVTGSAHTTLTPYWSKVLGKDTMVAHQISSRGGELICKSNGDRISISGKAQLYMSGTIYLKN